MNRRRTTKNRTRTKLSSHETIANRKARRSQRLLTLLIVVLVVIAIIMASVSIFITPIANKVSKEYHPNITRTQIIESNRRQAEANYDSTKVKSIRSEDILKARMNTDKILYQGYVAVPDIGINVPISLGVDNYNLSLGAGTLNPEQVMGQGNYVLASHFMIDDQTLLFTPLLKQGKVGQLIYLTDLNNIYVYKTTVHKIVASDDMSDSKPTEGKPKVTLVTCNTSSENGRVIQQGELTQIYKWDSAPQDIKDKLSNQDSRWIK